MDISGCKHGGKRCSLLSGPLEAVRHGGGRHARNLQGEKEKRKGKKEREDREDKEKREEKKERKRRARGKHTPFELVKYCKRHGKGGGEKTQG